MTSWVVLVVACDSLVLSSWCFLHFSGMQSAFRLQYLPEMLFEPVTDPLLPSLLSVLRLLPQAKGKTNAKKVATTKFVVECAEVVNEQVLVLGDFEKYLHDRIKVNGKAGNLGSKVSITKEKTRMVVNAELPFSKRYLKYLTKKYIKKTHLANFVRVVATSKGAYEIKIYQV